MTEMRESDLKTLVHFIRGVRIMIDADLARLYGVETKVLNQSVRRNISRFPSDFMLQLTDIEAENLRSQIVTSSLNYGGRRYLPMAFTELGIAMLSSVLKSEQAIQVNISIMRMPFELRDALNQSGSLTKKIETLEKNSHQLFRIVFERLDKVERATPPLSPTRRKIGF